MAESATVSSGTGAKGAGFLNVASGIGTLAGGLLGGIGSIIGASRGNPTAPIVLNAPGVDTSVASSGAIGGLDAMLANSQTLQRLSSGIGGSAASGAGDILKKYGLWIALGIGAIVLMTVLKKK
jgi:hypothetical protein